MIREYKTVAEIVSPLMMVRMVENVTYDELVEVELPDGSIRRGKVLEVSADTAVVQLFESAAGIGFHLHIGTHPTHGTPLRAEGLASLGIADNNRQIAAFDFITDHSVLLLF